MKFIDFFSGAGMFRIGMERAGHTCIGYVEINMQDKHTKLISIRKMNGLKKIL